MDPELAAILPFLPKLPFSDLAAARAGLEELLAGAPPLDYGGVSLTEREIPGAQGDPVVRIRILTPPGEVTERPGVLDIHGGGFAVGSAVLDDAVNVAIAQGVGAVVVSVDYRLAPEHPYPAPAEDCYAALTWFAEHAIELGVDPARIAVLGDSAGGGLAATTALLARDRGGPALAMQALLEPEVDDRLETFSMQNGHDTAVWYYDNAVLSWQFYLGEAEATAYSAPARMEDLSGLPPTYLTVNELDPLRDEGLAYAQALLRAGVPTELHCWPQAFHGFMLAAGASITTRAVELLVGALRRGLGVDVARVAESAAG